MEPNGQEPLTESEHWIAAHLRQLFRAHEAEDSTALQEQMQQFDPYLTLTVSRWLAIDDPMWKDPERWFDGLDAEPQFLPSRRLRLKGEVSWVIEQSHWLHDPFECEVALDPETDELKYVVFRFGDSRPMSDKQIYRATTGVPIGGWACSIERGDVPSPLGPFPPATVRPPYSPDTSEKNKPFEERDIRVEWENSLAAHVRQLHRAQRAGDQRAAVLSSMFVRHFLRPYTWFQLRAGDSSWQSRVRLRREESEGEESVWLQNLGRRFEQLDIDLEMPSANRLLARGMLCWLQDDTHRFYDPLEWELEFDPSDGTFRRSALRFGDGLPLEERTKPRDRGLVRQWAYLIESER